MYPYTPGCHRSPGRAVLSSGSDEVKIKGNRGACWDEWHDLSGGHDPYDSAVTPGRRFLRVLCVAVTGVAVGGASGPSNESTLAHRRLLREDQYSV